MAAFSCGKQHYMLVWCVCVCVCMSVKHQVVWRHLVVKSTTASVERRRRWRRFKAMVVIEGDGDNNTAG